MERHAGVIVIRVEQQEPRDPVVESGGPLQELDPVPVGQVQVGGDQRRLFVGAGQRGQLGETVRG
jgi:hypothetical protein